MPQLRRDPVTREWVIIATERQHRPSDYVHPNNHPAVPEFDPDCPFCPGAEAKAGLEVLAYRPPDTAPDAPGWWVRVVPNKYPALSQEGEPERQGYGMYDWMHGVGVHEVIVETPRHDLSISTMTHHQLCEVLWAYRDRCLDLSQDSRIRYTMLFRNHGTIAGASLVHPHSQLIALPMVPHEAEVKLKGLEAYYAFHERCAYCDMIRQELNYGQRIVAANDHFVAFAPFAPKYAFETIICPREHRRLFVEETRHAMEPLAQIMKDVMQRLDACLTDPPFNFTLHTGPVNTTPEPMFHWHLSIMPRLMIAAGFEMGTGIYINSTSPEEAARLLREVEIIGEVQKTKPMAQEEDNPTPVEPQSSLIQ
jgi:UDPglucose--hexose-1-phosphate uridylyltransferase